MDQGTKEALTLLAYLYVEHFKYEKAMNLLKALHLSFPDDIDITRTLGFACLKTGDFQAALQHSESSLKKGIDPKKIMAANLIKGKALWGLGREEAARHTLTKLGELEIKD